ncbi:MAG: type II toxin-antitoxin system RelE/ParE family toxin [Desulfovibrio sp.]|nr:type II toxin-antitoxin system RelE/ParE family toxin [Desulfovibrio sp.]
MPPNTPKENELSLIFSPEAEEQLAALYNHIADAASPDIAAGYTEAIVSYCEGLHTFLIRGTARDDVRPGLRITNYKKRAVIAFEVDEEAKQVFIIGLFYGGQDYETILQDDAALE